MSKQHQWIMLQTQATALRKRKDILSKHIEVLIRRRTDMLEKVKAEAIEAAVSKFVQDSQDYKTNEEHISLARDEWVATRDQMFSLQKDADFVYDQLELEIKGATDAPHPSN